MTLKQCSKAELMWIVNRILLMTCGANSDYYLSRALSDLSYEREKRRLDAADRASEIAHNKRLEYIELLKPYEGDAVIGHPAFGFGKSR